MSATSKNTMAWVSYITIVGWVIALLVYKDSQKGNSLLRYHLRQSLGLIILSFGVYLVFGLMSRFLGLIPGIGFLFALASKIANVGMLVLFVLGIINAVQGQEKPIPFVGDLFEEKLTFID